MKTEKRKLLFMGASTLLLFALWTLTVSIIDVRAIGPGGSTVGFATLNGFVHNFTGVHMSLYTITDWLGLVPIGVAFGFGVLGFMQLVKRKSILRVDSSIIILGVFYVVVMAIYALFEIVVINYRPVMINGYLEASYPSSTTMLVMCVMPTAAMQLNGRIKNKLIRRFTTFIIYAFVAFMVIARLISGVHWISDIIGGIILSVGLVLIYYSVTTSKKRK